MDDFVETEREEDGRWIAEVPSVPGCLAYGETEQEAIDRAMSLAGDVRGK
jgi:predicted RNase H-like HicB family nuclease